ncbi:caspase-1-like isoform X2 [Penaeus chinensis]|uniref:caspase-1-like isoform X2 n=1 Tax=Penaeus chinensis TaxID=139456 RepID=UPI001FB6CAE9|nr:caspase-1-like isoform X2 [Penaeus chinensis]
MCGAPPSRCCLYRERRKSKCTLQCKVIMLVNLSRRIYNSLFCRKQRPPEATMEDTISGGSQLDEPRGTNGQVGDSGSSETDALRLPEATMEDTISGGSQLDEPRGTNGQVGDSGSSETDALRCTDGMPQGLVRMSVNRDAVCYNMSHRQRGHCVIFNHRHFDQHTGLGERNGTDRDREQAQELFKNLGFQVTVYNDLTVKEVKKKLKGLAVDVNHSECDALAVVFMSHGEKNVLWGRDDTFKSDYLFENFKADRCPTLAGKPKLFFIQACRGEKLDAGTTLQRDELDSGCQSSYKIPNSADFLECWSTIPGHYSWRNSANGSWFIQSLVKVLTQDSAREDLLSMMTSVNRHLILNFESDCPKEQDMHEKKQAAYIVSTLMRKVYFNSDCSPGVGK